MSYEAWRVTFQSDEQAARSAYNNLAHINDQYAKCFQVATDLQREVKQLRNNVTGPWMDYPANDPIQNRLYLVEIEGVNSLIEPERRLIVIVFAHHEQFEAVNVKRFAEIRGQND